MPRRSTSSPTASSSRRSDPDPGAPDAILTDPARATSVAPGMRCLGLAAVALCACARPAPPRPVIVVPPPVTIEVVPPEITVEVVAPPPAAAPPAPAAAAAAPTPTDHCFWQWTEPHWNIPRGDAYLVCIPRGGGAVYTIAPVD